MDAFCRLSSLIVHFPYAPLGCAGWKELDVIAAIPWYTSRQKECMLLSVVQQKANYIFNRLECQGVSWNPLGVAVCARSDAIQVKVCGDIVQPLLADGMQEDEHFAADGFALMKVASV